MHPQRTRSRGLYARVQAQSENFWRYLNAGIKPTATCILQHSGYFVSAGVFVAGPMPTICKTVSTSFAPS
jgi:hypothetical protein